MEEKETKKLKGLKVIDIIQMPAFHRTVEQIKAKENETANK